MLDGPHPARFLPDIGPDPVHEALVREIGYLREEITEKPDSENRGHNPYRAYAVLTLCRVLYSSSTGRICSEAEAAHWAIDRLADEGELRRLVRLAERVRDQGFTGTVPLPAIGRLIEYVSRRVDARRAT